MNLEGSGDNDVSLLSQIIREAYSDTLATDTWTRVLDMIDGLVPYDAGGAIFANVQTGRLENRITSRVDGELLRAYRENNSAIEVLASVAVARKLTIWRPSDVIGKKEWEASILYNTLGKALGFGQPICMICGAATGIFARFWFARKDSKSDFSDRDRSVLELLQPHFSTALCLAKTVLQGDIYRESWQQTSMPRLILDAAGTITDMNIKAREYAEAGGGQDYLAQMEAIARDMIAGNVTLRNAELDGQRYRVWLSAVVFENAPTTYIMAIDTAADVRSLMRGCMSEAGCSEREAEVCMMLVHGASNREIAHKLFIAEATVKDHVTSIFEKLGVTKRSAVVPRLLGI